MFGAFTDRADARGRRLQPIIDDHAPVTGQSRPTRNTRLRADTDRHHHHVRGEAPAVLQPHRSTAVTSMAAVSASSTTRMPFASTSDFKRPAAARVELALHQPVHQVNQADIKAGAGETICGFDAEQAAPMTTADRPPPEALRIASTSARSRKVSTPGNVIPGIGRRIGWEPVRTSRAIR